MLAGQGTCSLLAFMFGFGETCLHMPCADAVVECKGTPPCIAVQQMERVCVTLLHIFDQNVPSDEAVAFLATEPDAVLPLSVGIGAVVVDFAWDSFCEIFEWIYE